MSVGVGTRIGVYEVTSTLGAGGMGVVYRARDTRLMRDVALKIVPDEFAIDPDRLARLTREAQLLASLNHPNIAQIYGLEQTPVSASHVIVMELVEGETLHDRLIRGRISLDEALHIARQIADALGAAHSRGVVHRDLKPANIKLTPDGAVKVLDFGLAKLEVSDAGKSAADLSNSPTITNVSMPGVILGTLAYMSPEQARGKTADARSDIWAFGCVLFEMLAGRQPFAGETATDVLARVVTGEPAWDRLPDDVTPSIRTLLLAALTKDPKHRLQHIGDARLFLTAPLDPHPATSSSARTARSTWRLTAGVGALAAATAAAWFVYGRRAPAGVTEIRFEMPAPGFVDDLTISPDGQRVAYVATSEGRPRIWIRPIGSLNASPLAGTEGAAGLFWSPDSRNLAFVTTNGLQRVDVSGTPPQKIAEDFNPLPGTWNRDGTILFSTLDRGRQSLVRVSSSGGDAKIVGTTVSPDGINGSLLSPQFLPDGRHFLFIGLTGGSGRALDNVLYVGSLDSTMATRLMALDSIQPESFSSVGKSFRYVEPGYLLFKRNEALMAQRFDPSRFSLVGDAVPLADGIQGFSASDNGTLVYRKARDERGDPPGVAQLQWFDRAGKPAGQPLSLSYPANPRLAPDGRRIAVDAVDGRNRDIWVIDVARSVTSRLTFDPASDTSPVWAPDGNQIAFSSARIESSSRAAGANSFRAGLYSKPANGGGNDTLLLASDEGELLIPEDWSADGRFIIFRRVKIMAAAKVQPDLWALPMFGDRRPFPVVQSPAVKGFARLSPDGRWLAYATNESGPFRVVVQPFPDTSKGKWQVSSGPAGEVVWRGDGRELFYRAQDKLMAVSIGNGDVFETESPRVLFDTPPTPPGQGQTGFDATADGQRFLFNTLNTRPASETTSASVPITAVVNWTAALSAR